MATQSDKIPGRGYGNALIDALVWGCAWTTDPVRFYFGDGEVLAADSSIGTFTGGAWSDEEKLAFTTALAQYSAVCNLQFTAASSASAADADIVWWLAPASAMGARVLGMHEVPDNSWQPIYGYFNKDDPTWANLEVGSYGYVTVIHELGHALGLAHPHDGGDQADATQFPGVRGPRSTGTNGLNQGIWTTMSYNDGWQSQPSPSSHFGYQGGPMALDIAALQAIYGANNATASGDDSYHLPDALADGTYWTCIWDVGGSDTISNEGAVYACTINLNAAPLVGANAAGYVSWNSGIPGGYTIANGVVIENATGGSGNDTLIGNAADNVLDGGEGVDRMFGGHGNDTYLVTAGDIVTEGKGAGGRDTIIANTSWTLPSRDSIENLVLLDSAGRASATGNKLGNTVTGNGSANLINGGAGSDTLIGNGGADVLIGGKGADVFVYVAIEDSPVGQHDVVKDFSLKHKDRIDLSQIDADANAAQDQAFTFIAGAPFSGTAGELRFDAGLLSGDTNGDGLADFEIELVGLTSLPMQALVL